jgi:hypothetical protein
VPDEHRPLPPLGHFLLIGFKHEGNNIAEPRE